MQAILAIDSGGSKTEALLVGRDGERLGFGRSQTSGHFGDEDESGGFGRTEASLCQAVQQALPDPSRFPEYHLGLCGVAHPHPAQTLSLPVRTQMRMDEDLPCRVLMEQPFGLVALAGTGALVVGMSRTGERVRLDGMGPLLGDHGSGFSLGLRAIQAAACADWHPRRATTLESAILESAAGSLDVHHPIRVLHFLDVRHRSRIAACAALVDREARRGDAIAAGILRDGALELAETVRDTADRMNLDDVGPDLIGGGSVLMKSDIYWETFVQRVADLSPALRPRRMRIPPVVGVALQILAGLDGVDYGSARSRLLANYTVESAQGKI